MELCSFLLMESSNLSVDFRSGLLFSSVEVSMRGVEFSSLAPELGPAPFGFGVEESGGGCKVLASDLHDSFVRGSGHSELGENWAVRFSILASKNVENTKGFEKRHVTDDICTKTG